MTCAAMLNASFWTRMAPSTLRSASRLCGSVRSAAATAVSAMTTCLTNETGRILQRGQRGLHLAVVWLVTGVLEHFLVADDAAPVDDERRALGDVLHADHVGVHHAVGARDVLVEVAQQRLGQLLGLLPCAQREKGVDRDAQDVGRAEKIRRLVPKGAHLGGARAAERRRHEREDHGALLQLLAERHRLAILVHQSEIGRLGAYVCGHRTLLAGAYPGRCVV